MHINTSALATAARHGTTAARAQVRQLRSRHPSVPLCAYGLVSLSTVSRLPKPPSPRLPTTTQSRSNRSGGHHRSRHATDHSVLPSRHDARRCGCPAAPNHPGRALWRKAGKSLHPSKEPPTPPKEPLYPPPKSTNPLVVRCVPPCSPWAHLTARPCPACPCPTPVRLVRCAAALIAPDCLPHRASSSLGRFGGASSTASG